MENLVDIVQNLSNFYIPCGAERQGCDQLRESLMPFFENVKSDALGNLICLVNKGESGQKKVLLEAHIDEISLVVSKVDDEGFIHVISPYGMDIRAAFGKEMHVHGRRTVYGVMSSTPPHLKGPEREKAALEWESCVIDVGLCAEKARALISPGDRATFAGAPKKLLNNRVCGRALDNRAGAAIVLKAAQMLRRRPLSCGLWVLLSVQEEAGTKGAAAGGYAVDPYIAIVVDVSFGRMPGVEAYESAPLGKGIMPGIAPILDYRLYKDICRAAEECKVAVRPEVMTGSTGTNASALQRVRAGVRTALLSVPLLNMHTSAEIVSLSDMEDAAAVIARFMENQ